MKILKSNISKTLLSSILTITLGLSLSVNADDSEQIKSSLMSRMTSATSSFISSGIGAMLPIGDAKGSALAMMVEILAAGLTGSNFGFEASSFLNAEGDSPGVGQLIIAIDPKFFSGEQFSERTETIVDSILEQPSTRLPGNKRLEKRKLRESSQSITISKELFEKITLLT